jgi:hypothetical protein
MSQLRGATAALVDVTVANNATWNDAWQFGNVGDTSWDLTGQAFKLEVKASRNDLTPLATFTSSGGTIVVDDIVQRVIHMNVPDATIQADLPVGCYVYDLIMFDGSTPSIRVQLMTGHLEVKQGVTQD